MDIAILLYDRLTVLDVIGPYEVLQQLPGATLRFVAREKGPLRSDTGLLTLVAEHDFDSVPRADVLVVGGGLQGTFAAARDERTLDWVRRIHATSRYTTSVCTGALILGAAGLLKGLRATTHWAARPMLAAYGAEPVAERVVVQGKVITAAGVSSGIDMALRLAAEIAGEDVARMIQLGIEYDPDPPFDGGSRETSPPAIVAAAEQMLQRAMQSG
jgi:transcriptional regulator GlxA family with amidase domain